ncbi:putative reverse transcriptase domain-containing protein, partial [Tanacetum coccineum]
MKIHHRVQGSGKKAIIEVMVSLEKNQTCSLVKLPAGKKASQRLWMFKVKEEQDGSKSFMQKDKVRVICHEPMLLLKEDGSSCIRQLLNVDDMLVAGSNMLPLVFEMKDRCSKKQVLGYVLTVGITTSEWESGLQKSITIDVHQVGDEIEVKVLHSFNWPSCELITEDGVLPERDFVMTDSEDSTVTYTEVSSPFEGMSDIGSPGVDGLPMMLEDPYVEASLQAPPSPDYVPGPEHPPSLVYVPYVPESSDPVEDLKEEDEDPKEDPADYPTDKDNDKEEEPSGDDADDKEEEEEDKDEEEEEDHLALADSIPPPVCCTTTRMSIRDQTPIPFPSAIEVDRFLATSTPPLSPLTLYSSPLPHIPYSPLPVSSPLHVSSPPLPASPTYPLGYGAAMIRLRAESPSTSHPLPLPSPIVLPHTRASVTMMRVAAPSTNILASQSETPPSGTPPLLPIPLPTPSPSLLLSSTVCKAGVSKVTLPPRKRLYIALDDEIRRDPEREVGYGITDTWDEMVDDMHGIPAASDVVRLSQRMTDFVTTVRQDTNEIYGRLDDVQSMDASATVHYKVRALRTTALTQQTKIVDLQAADHRRPVVVRRFGHVIAMLYSLLSVADALVARDADRCQNGEDSHDLGTGGRRQAPLDHEMFPEESDKIEKYVGGLPDMIHGSSENKRKQDDNQQQQQNKRQNTGRAYAAGSSEKKPYGGSKPLCSKCNYHHDGQCAPKCHKCNRVGHLACDCRNTTNSNTANNQRGTRASQKPTCFECGAQGHFKRECPKLKNNNRGNQGGNGNAPAKVYAVGHAGTNPDSNVVTGTFLLNNRYASVLFDTGADRSFVSTTFSSQIDITPSTLDHYYDVELADGRIIGFNAIIRGCTLNFLNQPFNIDLMPVELGSLDVIIGMDWLARYQAVIVCAEKIICIPWGNETLIVCGDGSDR